jgi:YVTN family beta-propeller protein
MSSSKLDHYINPFYPLNPLTNLLHLFNLLGNLSEIFFPYFPLDQKPLKYYYRIESITLEEEVSMCKNKSFILFILIILFSFPSLCLAQSDSVVATISVGKGPIELLWDSTFNKLYCANNDTNTISVIDGVTNAVITTIFVGNEPFGLAYQGNKVYCASSGSDSVAIIDGTNDSVIKTVSVGDRPYDLLYNPQNNKIYCSNWLDSTVTIIDGAADTVLKNLKVGNNPYALLYNPQNNKVYCANFWSDNVSIIDGAKDSVLATVTVGGWPEALIYNNGNNKIYCANYSGPSISVIACSPGTAVEEDQESQVISDFSLMQNYPNPFNPTTAIPFTVHGSRFMVHRPIHTTLKIYNLLGQRVRTLVDEPKERGNHEVIWDGKDDKGKEVASGIYFYQLKVGEFTECKKMLLLK